MAHTLVVTKPVIDLRKSPGITLPNDYSHQDERETQLLLGENLLLIEDKTPWLKVGAVEQLRFTPQEGWHPYPGWIHISEIQEASPAHPTHVTHSFGPHSYGTLLSHFDNVRPIPKIPNRTQLVAEAHQFIGAPYLWGGRSSPIPHTIASVDCSGLVNLLYRAQGIHLPRDAHDQYLISHPTTHLQPGDPLFLTKSSRITHVILKFDATTFIEAPETHKTVRLLTWGHHIWQEDDKIKIFDRPHAYTSYPRTFLSDQKYE